MVVSCSGRFITEDSNVVSKFTPGFMVLFDKGFNVQDLFLPKQVKCMVPPFCPSKKGNSQDQKFIMENVLLEREST